VQRFIVVTLLVLGAAFGGLLYLIGVDAQTVVEKRRAFAIAGMTSGLIVVWIWLGGGLMFRHRDAICRCVRALPGDWRVKFVGFAVALACLEEVVTVSMTNLAQEFGSRIGEAYITASTNYFDVIAFHSVVVFIPMFVALALVLARYDFTPFAVFIAFGVVGTACEAMFAGNPAAFVMFPVWAFVYGLMVWLPARAVPEARGARRVGIVHHVLLAPAILLLALPMIAPIVYVISVVLAHPAIDFAAR
jgi:hypothetical protein